MVRAHTLESAKPVLSGARPAAQANAPGVGGQCVPPAPEAEAALTDLYLNIVGALPEQACRVVQFVAASRQDGSSIIVRQLALTLACQLGRRVLLVDALNQAPLQLQYFKIAPGSEGGAQHESGEPFLATPIPDASLQIATQPMGVDSIAIAANAERLNAWLKAMRAHYDFILIDLPALGAHQAWLQVSTQIDGVVLTARAGRTRWHTVNRWVESLTAQGARVLGVMLNKVDPPIPQCIYDLL